MKQINFLLKLLSDLTGFIAVAFLLFLMLGTTTDIFVRSLSGRSIPGVFELSELSMVGIVFFGLGWTKIDNAHIRVTLLNERVSGRTRQVLEFLSWGAAALAVLILAVPSTEDAIRSFSIREFRWGYVQFPIWWAKILLAIGLWLAFVQMAVHALAVLLGSTVPDSGKQADSLLHQ